MKYVHVRVLLGLLGEHQRANAALALAAVYAWSHSMSNVDWVCIILTAARSTQPCYTVRKVNNAAICC
jgi:folylpolyglutamate synthase/dihydropteroate synthase